MAEKNGNKIIKSILMYDVRSTRNLVKLLLNFTVFRSLKYHSKFLEISCHGILWLAGWLAFCWFLNNSALYEMQVNMLFGLVIDIILVAIIKASTRRRRPSKSGFFDVGPDKFSFPSGHASRAFFIVGFFTLLQPLPFFIRPALFVWACAVSLSRILCYRHHLLDVCAGITLGIMEALLLHVIWLGPEFSKAIMQSLSEDYVPGGAE